MTHYAVLFKGIKFSTDSLHEALKTIGNFIRDNMVELVPEKGIAPTSFESSLKAGTIIDYHAQLKEYISGKHYIRAMKFWNEVAATSIYFGEAQKPIIIENTPFVTKHLFQESSLIKSAEYKEKEKLLTIELLGGKFYTYNNIAASLWVDFVNAESPGKFYNKHIKTLKKA